MIRLLYLILLLCPFAFSCNTGGENNTHAERQTDSISAIKNTKNFYKRLEGTIAGKNVVMHLALYEDQIEANYYYTDEGRPIQLYLNHEAIFSKDTVQLIEQQHYLGDNPEDSLPPKMNIVITYRGVKGEWISGNEQGRYPMDLRENYPDSSYKFDIAGRKDSVVITKYGKDTLVGKSAVMIPDIAMKSARSFYLKSITDSLSLLSPEDSSSKHGQFKILNDYTDNLSKAFLGMYSRDVDSFFVQNDVDTSQRFSFLNYEQFVRGNLMYNNNGFAVLYISGYQYTGGAHGMDYTSLYCLDVANSNKMVLSDVVNIDSANLQLLVEKHFRQQNKIKPKASLKKILFENKLPANNNFYFTSKGIGFIYNPYEVAAYVYGNIHVWIPFTELHPYLNHEFKKRMNL